MGRTEAGTDARTGRRARKRARTRSEILDAALPLFETRGFEAVTVEEICQAADVARGTFFLHFPAKSALLHAWSRRLASELRARMGEPRGSAAAEYRMVVDHVGRRWPQHADGMAAVLCDGMARPGEDDDAGPTDEEDLRALVAEIVRRGQERGEFRRNVAPTLAATALLATAAAAFSGAVFRAGEATPEEIRNQLLHAALHGLVQPKPRIKWQPPLQATPTARA